MNGAISNALMEMQGALVARSLYPSGHPRIKACEERALKLFHEVLEQRPEITSGAFSPAAKADSCSERCVFDLARTTRRCS